jgi:FkbM family methyltransferase
MKYYSQEIDCQDYKLHTTVFKDHTNGFFVDVGAYDGETFNNTLFFEENYDWKGINFEPIPEIFDKLSKRRPNCINYNVAVSDVEGEAEFCCNDMLSGLQTNYDPRHINRINDENNQKYNSRVLKIQTRRLDEVLKENGVKRVNYLSIDVEGAEFSVIKSINFDEVFIDVICFENNYQDASIPIIEYLKEKGYFVIFRGLDIFMIHNNSEFVNNF